MIISKTSKYKIFLVDNESFLILCEVSSVPIANALSLGLLNTTVMVVNIDQDYSDDLVFRLLQTVTVQKIGEGNAAFISKDLDKKKRHAIELFDSPSERFLERKKLSKVRRTGIQNLERGCQRYLARLHDFFADTDFYSALIKELDICDPANNFYTEALIDYSKILRQDVSTTYKELKMMYDSYSASVFKMHALWRKYVDKINLLSDPREIHICSINQFESEIFLSEL